MKRNRNVDRFHRDDGFSIQSHFDVLSWLFPCEKKTATTKNSVFIRSLEVLGKIQSQCQPNIQRIYVILLHFHDVLCVCVFEAINGETLVSICIFFYLIRSFVAVVYWNRRSCLSYSHSHSQEWHIDFVCVFVCIFIFPLCASCHLASNILLYTNTLSNHISNFHFIHMRQWLVTEHTHKACTMFDVLIQNDIQVRCCVVLYTPVIGREVLVDIINTITRGQGTWHPALRTLFVVDGCYLLNSSYAAHSENTLYTHTRPIRNLLGL